MCFSADVSKAKIDKVSRIKAEPIKMKSVGSVDYTPINQNAVPSLVGSSLYDYVRNMDPTGFSAGGLTAGYDNGTVTLNASPERQQLIDDLQGQFGAQADEVMALKGTVAPGMSEFRASALARLEDSRKAALSNLRDNFSRRGILGSSFGEDAINRQNMEYEREAERINTEAYLKEVELTNNLLNQQYEASVNQFNTGLNELNLRTEVAAKLSSDANQWFSNTNQLLTQMAAQDQNVRSQFAAIDAENELKAQIANMEAKLAVASGNQRAQLEAQLADANYRLSRASIRQSANNAQAQMDQDTLGGFGELAGAVLTAPMTGGGSLLGTMFT